MCGRERERDRETEIDKEIDRERLLLFVCNKCVKSKIKTLS